MRYRIQRERSFFRSGTSFLLLLTGLAGCGKKEDSKKDKEQPPVAIRTEKAKVRPLTPKLEVIGTVIAVPEKYATLTAPIPGIVEKLVVKEGQQVKEHKTVIIQMDSREAQIAFDRADAAYKRLIAAPRPEELAQAKGTVAKMKAAHALADARLKKSQELRERSKELVPDVQWLDDVRIEQIARAEFDAAEAQLQLLQKGPREEQRKEAYVEVEAAKLHLAFCKVIAPIDGEVVEIRARVGQRADVNTPLATILDTSEVLVQARIPADRLQEIAEALKDPKADLGEVRSVSFTKTGLAIKSGWLSQQTEALTGDVPVRLRVPNPDGGLRVGMTVQVELHGVKVEALAIPEKALTVNEDGKYVVTLIKEDKAVPTEVELAPEGGRELRTDGYVRIVKGLEAGDEVATENGYALPEGTPVKVLPAEEAKSDHH